MSSWTNPSVYYQQQQQIMQQQQQNMNHYSSSPPNVMSSSYAPPRRPSQLPLSMSYSLPRRENPRVESSKSSQVMKWERAVKENTQRSRGGGVPRTIDNSLLGCTFRGLCAFLPFSPHEQSAHSPPGSPVISPPRTAAAHNPLASNGGKETAAQKVTSYTAAALNTRRGSIGGSSSTSSLPSPSQQLSITSMATHPGHMAVALQGGNLFAVFDAAHDSQDLSSHDTDRLRAFFRRKRAPASVIESTGVKDDSFQSSMGGELLALRTVDSTIVSMIFIASRTVASSSDEASVDTSAAASRNVAPLRLLILQQNGSYLIWEYALSANPTTPFLHWQYVSRGSLPSPVASVEASKRNVLSAVYDESTSTVVWLEKKSTSAASPLALYATTITALQQPILPDTIDATQLVRTGFTHKSGVHLRVTRRGVFVLPLIHSRTYLSNLYYYSTLARQLVRVSVSDPNASEGVSSAAVFAVHPHSSQLFAVDTNRRVLQFRELEDVTADSILDSEAFVQMEIVSSLQEIVLPVKINSKGRQSISSSVTSPTSVELLAGSHLAVFRQNLCITQPASSSTTVTNTFYTIDKGVYLCHSNLELQPIDQIFDSSSDDEDSELNGVEGEGKRRRTTNGTSLASSKNPLVLQSVVSCKKGFGGVGLLMYTQREIFCLKVTSVSQQTQVLLKNAPTSVTIPVTPFDQPVLLRNPTVPVSAPVDATLARANKTLSKLMNAADTIIPAVGGLIPASLLSSPGLTAASSSSAVAVPPLVSLESPMLNAQPSFQADSLSQPLPAHLATQLLQPYKESTDAYRTKHQLSRFIGKLAGKPLVRPSGEVDEHELHNNSIHQVLQLGSDNLTSAPHANNSGGADGMKEGGVAREGEGEGSSGGEAKYPTPSPARRAVTKKQVTDPALSPFDNSWYPPILKSLQSPALAISLFHLPTALPSAYSSASAVTANPLLQNSAFNAHTFDAEYERQLRDEITKYLHSMSPVTRTGRSRTRETMTSTSRPHARHHTVDLTSSSLSANGNSLRRSHSTRSRDEERKSDSDHSDDSSTGSSTTSSPRSLSPSASTLSASASFSLSSSSTLPTSSSYQSSNISRRSQLKRCFEHYTPLSLQTLPLIRQYYRVLRLIRKLKHGEVALDQSAREREEKQEGEFDATETNGLTSTASTFFNSTAGSLSHPATFVAPLPSLQQQLSKALTNRLTSLSTASSSLSFNVDRSFTSLVLHDSDNTLEYLLRVLELQNLQPQPSVAASSSSSARPSTSSVTLSSSSSESRVLPSLLLVNEETKFRKDLLNSALNEGNKEALPVGQQARLDSLPYFETIVRLLDEHKPQLLLEFVKLNDDLFGINKRKKSNSDDATSSAPLLLSQNALLTTLEMESHVERALRILPPIHSAAFASSKFFVGSALSSSSFRNHRMETNASDHQAANSSSLAAAEQLKQRQRLQMEQEQLRLERIAARCSLLVLSGRPVEAISLRLKMALDEGDSSQEDAAIVLAGQIVQQQEEIESRRWESSNAKRKMSLPDDEKKEPSHAMTEVVAAPPPSAAVYALRAELFHILFTYWLQQQFTLQYQTASSHYFQQPSKKLDRHGLASAVGQSFGSFMPVLTSLDSRISALRPPNYTFATYFELIDRQKTIFLQELADEHREQEFAERRRNAKLAESLPVDDKSPLPQQRASSDSAFASLPPSDVAAMGSARLWPASSPLFLPSPAVTQECDSMTSPLVNLPMSCLLPQLKQFAEQL